MTRPLTVVTGGGRGIGAATARRLADEGHDLVLGYARNEEAAERTADEVRTVGATCRTVRADVSDPVEVDAPFDAVAEWGTLIGLVNNAGATLHLGDPADTPVDVIQRVIAVNLTGAVLCALTNGLAQEVAPRIRVFGVAPGGVRTGIHADAGDASRPDRAESR